jgi:ketoreductase RED1
MARRWHDLGTPELTADVVDELVGATERDYGADDYATLTNERDVQQVAILSARQKVRDTMRPSTGTTAGKDTP